MFSWFNLSRTNRSRLSQWWWTVDRWMLLSALVLMVVGFLLIFTASPSVARQHAWTALYFVRHHAFTAFLGATVMIGVSLLSPKGIRILALGILAMSIMALFMVLLSGTELKGARRWLRLGGVSFQPSEWIKPALAVTSAWVLDLGGRHIVKPISCRITVAGLYFVILGLLFAQPDVGMSILVLVTAFAQLFVRGLSYVWIGGAFTACLGSLGLAYLSLSHVRARVDRFLGLKEVDPYGGHFQVLQSLEAFAQGGLIGKGPGEGTVKKVLPDAHADFIFAVAGEEFGAIFCALLIVVYVFIAWRALQRAMHEVDDFVVLAVSGLVAQFMAQIMINMGSALHLIPPKGMTLPFLSYGGSALLGSCIAMGMILSLTRKRVIVGPVAGNRFSQRIKV